MLTHSSKYFTGSQQQETEIAKIMCLPRAKVLQLGAEYWTEGPSSYSDLKNFVFATSACLWQGFENSVPSMFKNLDSIFKAITDQLVRICKFEQDPFRFLNQAGELKQEIIEVIRSQVYFKKKIGNFFYCI